MALKIQHNIPIPSGRLRDHSGQHDEITETILTLKPGDSFFAETPPDVESTDRFTAVAIFQRRINVRGANLRKAGREELFLITKQCREDVEDEDGTIRKDVLGIRIWRRPLSESEFLGSETEEV